MHKMTAKFQPETGLFFLATWGQQKQTALTYIVLLLSVNNLENYHSLGFVFQINIHSL